MMASMRPSILVLNYKRRAELRACLDALARDGAPAKAEVVVGLNGAPEENAVAAAELAVEYPWVKTVRLSRLDRGTARNRLADAASGDPLYFLDDDTVPPPGFLDRVAEAFARWPAALAVGGPNLGLPGDAALPRAVDFLLRSYLGAGPMAVRHRAEGPEEPSPSWTFTLSNFGARRAAFDAGLRFPGRAESAEETLFIHELGRLGGVAVHAPRLAVWHRRRATMRAFLRQTFTCGLGRAQITRAAPTSLIPAVLAPLVCAATAAVLALRRPDALAALAGLYAALVAVETVRMLVLERDAAALLLPALYPLAHAAYAAGLAAGAAAWPASDAAIDPRLPWRLGQSRVR